MVKSEVQEKGWGFLIHFIVVNFSIDKMNNIGRSSLGAVKGLHFGFFKVWINS